MEAVSAQVIHPQQMRPPVSPVSSWVRGHDDPTAVDGSPVVNPASITTDRVKLIKIGGLATSLLVRLAYPAALTGITNPKVQVWGRDPSGNWMKLYDSDDTHVLTLTTDPTNDQTDGTLKRTQHVQVDCWGCLEAATFLNTALAGSNATPSDGHIEGKAA